MLAQSSSRDNFCVLQVNSFDRVEVQLIVSKGNKEQTNEKPPVIFCNCWVALQRDNIGNPEFYPPDRASGDIWIVQEDKGVSSWRICEML